MADINHTMGGDLVLGPTGDLGAVTGTTMGQQRVLRRLLTSEGDYLWQLAYGAGLPRRVGEVANATRIRATVRRQIFREAAVARTPAPVITVSASPDGTVLLAITYTDAQTGETVPLFFPISPQPSPTGG